MWFFVMFPKEEWASLVCLLCLCKACLGQWILWALGMGTEPNPTRNLAQTLASSGFEAKAHKQCLPPQTPPSSFSSKFDCLGLPTHLHHFQVPLGEAPDTPTLPRSDMRTSPQCLHYFQKIWAHWVQHPEVEQELWGTAYLSHLQRTMGVLEAFSGLCPSLMFTLHSENKGKSLFKHEIIQDLHRDQISLLKHSSIFSKSMPFM